MMYSTEVNQGKEGLGECNRHIHYVNHYHSDVAKSPTIASSRFIK